MNCATGAMAAINQAPWYEVAVKEIGVKEAPGPDKANPRILEYFKPVAIHSSSDEIHWCSAFVNWCLQEAGYQGTRSAAARSFMNWGEAIKEPRLGCVVVLKRGTGWQGHVGFYEGQKAGGRITILGGNQSDSVCSANFLIDSVIGYRWPERKK